MSRYKIGERNAKKMTGFTQRLRCARGETFGYQYVTDTTKGYQHFGAVAKKI